MVKSVSIIAVFLCTICGTAVQANAQELYNEVQGIWRAKVVEVVSEELYIVPGTDVESSIQTLRVEILEGSRAGEVLTFQNDFISLKEGQRFFMNYLETIQGDQMYSVRDVDRRLPIYIFLGLFAAVIIGFGGFQGVRSLVSLLGSLLVIMYVLLPSILGGMSPVLVSTFVAAGILFIAIFFTHGFNRESSVAFGGTVISISITILLAYIAVSVTHLTGFASDEATYLNLSTGGTLDMAGLLLGAIIIGVLGVLDDIAITQSAVVSELYASGGNLTRLEVYKRALRVGREHVGALVNTLALAYAGASLPLLLLFSTSSVQSIGAIINQEVFATEIIRTIVGSIGLILTVPITTGLAVHFLEKYAKSGKRTHSHSHGHSHSH